MAQGIRDLEYPPDGQPGEGAASSIADGADVTQGAVADAAVTTNTTGTISGKLRGLVAIFADVWDSTLHLLGVKSQGNVASGVADSGNPVKVGSVYNSTAPSPSTGQRVDLQSNSRGSIRVGGGDPLGVSAGFAMTMGINDINGQTRVVDAGSVGDGPNYPMAVMMYGRNSTQTVRRRIADTLKTVSATASGNTAIWTPGASKKFRLMRFKVLIPANAAISGGGVVLTVKFQDATTDIGVSVDVFIPTTAVTTAMGAFSSGWIDLDHGALSAAANNVLNVNLSATLTTGNVRVIVAGMEE